MSDYFEVLGLSRSASDSEIKEAYRRLAKEYHPDSNPDTDSAARMRRLNQAKEILFDPVKREEHRVYLGLREKVAQQRIEQMMRTRLAPPKPPQLSWTKRQARKFYVGAALVGTAVVTSFVGYAYLMPHPKLLPPIEQIIERNRSEALPFDKPEVDTLTVPDDTLPRLLRKAEILFGFGEFKSAAKYWEKCLEKDPNNETIIRNLSMAYFKRGKYAKSLEVLSRQMHGDSNLVVAYYNIGELFKHEERPFDARNAFEEVLTVANRMQREGRPTQYAALARRELAELE